MVRYYLSVHKTRQLLNFRETVTIFTLTHTHFICIVFHIRQTDDIRCWQPQRRKTCTILNIVIVLHFIFCFSLLVDSSHHITFTTEPQNLTQQSKIFRHPQDEPFSLKECARMSKWFLEIFKLAFFFFWSHQTHTLTQYEGIIHTHTLEREVKFVVTKSNFSSGTATSTQLNKQPQQPQYHYHWFVQTQQWHPRVVVNQPLG